MLTLTTKPFNSHKEAERPDDCQDACAQNDEKGRYAIADGATRSFFPMEWATLLVAHFCENTDLSLPEADWRAWIFPIQQRWYEQVKEKVNERNVFYLTNPFNTQEPAVSTFIGIEFNKDNGRWKAMIIGDSCLFHESESGFKSYLIENSADFTNRPEVLVSYAKDNLYEPSFRHGQAKPGDTFILATDALARWILEHKEAAKLETLLMDLKKLKTNAEFRQFVEIARHDESIRLVNDDVTLILISVENAQNQQEANPDASSHTKTLKPTQQHQRVLSLIFFGGILAAVVAFFVWVIMLF